MVGEAEKGGGGERKQGRMGWMWPCTQLPGRREGDTFAFRLSEPRGLLLLSSLQRWNQVKLNPQESSGTSRTSGSIRCSCAQVRDQLLPGRTDAFQSRWSWTWSGAGAFYVRAALGDCTPCSICTHTLDFYVFQPQPEMITHTFWYNGCCSVYHPSAYLLNVRLLDYRRLLNRPAAWLQRRETYINTTWKQFRSSSPVDAPCVLQFEPLGLIVSAGSDCLFVTTAALTIHVLLNLLHVNDAVNPPPLAYTAGPH